MPDLLYSLNLRQNAYQLNHGTELNYLIFQNNPDENKTILISTYFL